MIKFGRLHFAERKCVSLKIKCSVKLKYIVEN